MSRADRPEGRPRRPTRLLACILLAFALALTGAGCSDAPTEAQIERADDGVDPRVVVVLITPDLEAVTEQLGKTFTDTRRGATFRYVVDSPENIERRIADGYRPSLWIDTVASIGTVAGDPKAQGAPTEFGETPLWMVVHEDAGIVPPPTIDVFGSDTEPPTGLCVATVACGAGARLAIEGAGVTPAPDLEAASSDDLIQAIVNREVDVAMLYRPDAARIGSVTDHIPLSDPTVGLLRYQTIAFGRAPVAAEFQRWVTSSPAASEILVKYGWKNEPPVARP